MFDQSILSMTYTDVPRGGTREHQPKTGALDSNKGAHEVLFVMEAELMDPTERNTQSGEGIIWIPF